MVGIHTLVRSRRKASTVAVMCAATALLTLAGCGGQGSSANGPHGFPEAKQEASSTITVWVDADRQAAAKAFQAANPDTKIKVVTYDGSANGSNSFRTKVHSSTAPAVAGPMSSSPVRTTTRRGPARRAAASRRSRPCWTRVWSRRTPQQLHRRLAQPCTVDGRVYCLRNDLAQAVLWYDKSLLEQFGYAVPTTWEEYQALGEKVAKEHPVTSSGRPEMPGRPRCSCGRASARPMT